MPSLSSPKSLYFTRLAQLLFAIGFLILVSWCGTHRSWWDNINGAVAVGIIATILTLALTTYTLVTSHLKKSNPFSNPSTLLKTLSFIALELLIFLLWIATIVLMVRHKGGCDRDLGQRGDGDREEDTGKDICFPKGDEGKKDGRSSYFFDRVDQPLWQWNLAVGFAAVEVLGFLVTAGLVWREGRGKGGGGGAGGAGASYA